MKESIDLKPSTNETNEAGDKEGEATTDPHTANNSDDKKSGEERREDGIGIPHILDADKYNLDEIHKHPKLPQMLEVLDGMGLGPKGPPIPPPATFAVIPFPTQRNAPPSSELNHYIFVSNMENDP